MSQSVWILSVDLQAKTATFQSGMAEAARSARGAFTDIKSGSGEMGREVGGSMMEARHGVMMLGEEFGIHLPRGLTTFIASIGPVGAAMEAAFPFLAIALGATLLIEHLVKLHEQGEKLTQDQVKFATASQTAFNTLDEKLLQAGIKADELRGDHLGALKQQLELIDRQSMAELVQQFDTVAKAAEAAFADMPSHWYTFGIGATGAKHALQDFQGEYALLLAKGKSGEAADLLKGTRESAERVLAMQKQAAAVSGGVTNQLMGSSDETAAIEARNVLKKAGVGYTEKEVAAQEDLVRALQTQGGIQERLEALKKAEGANATRTTGGAMSSEASAATRAAVDSQLRMGQMVIAADKATAASRLTIARASIDERLASDLDFAQRELQIQLAANDGQIAALDKLSKDYPNQLKSLHEKAQELQQQHETTVTELTARAATERAARDLQTLEQSEREAIETTQQGSAERLAAIDAALRQEESRNLQDTAFYRDLQTQRVQTARQAAEEEAKLKADAARQAAEQEMTMGELMLAAQRGHQQLIDSSRHMSEQQRTAEAISQANAEYALKATAMSQEIAALDKGGKDYNNKLAELQGKQKQLVQQHENEITDIKEKAEIARNTRILTAEHQALDQLGTGLTQSIMGHETWAAMITRFGDQVAEGLIKNSLLILMQQDKERLGDARKAATSAYAAGESMGGPLGIVLGPVFAAAAFAGVMAFEKGGIVPGIGSKDVVPAILTPGEAVLPKAMVERLATASGGGNVNNYHAHVRPVYNLQALDAAGMDKILEKHSDTLNKHVGNTLRKMNRGTR